MRIMYIIHSLYIGGAETITANYLIELKKRGFEVCLIEVWHSESFLYDKLKEHGIVVMNVFDEKNDFLSRFKRKIFLATRIQNKVKHFVKDFKPDIIHNHSTMAYLKEACFPMDRVFFTFHCDLARYLSKSSAEEVRYLRNCVDNGLNLIAISSNILKDVKREFATSNVSVIPNGICIDEIKSEAYTRDDLERRFGIERDAFLVGHIGRFHKVKNHERLIEIFKSIHDRRKDSYLLLVGGGTNQETRTVMDKVDKLGLKSSVIFAGVCRDSAAIASAFDVMIIPSFAESFSLVLVEAQVHNVRCIGSSVIPKEVFCNRNCISLPLEAGNDVWAEYALNGFERDMSSDIRQFDIDVVIDKHIEIYTKASI